MWSGESNLTGSTGCSEAEAAGWSAANSVGSGDILVDLLLSSQHHQSSSTEKKRGETLPLPALYKYTYLRRPGQCGLHGLVLNHARLHHMSQGLEGTVSL